MSHIWRRQQLQSDRRYRVNTYGGTLQIQVVAVRVYIEVDGGGRAKTWTRMGHSGQERKNARDSDLSSEIWLTDVAPVQ